MAFFHEDGVLGMPRSPESWGSRHQGSVAVRRVLQSRFEGIPDVHYGD